MAENLDALDRAGKMEVLDLSERLSGDAPGRDTRAALLAYAGAIPAEDLDLMK
ncbi:MAG: hypothetical protein H0U65_10625 [Rubrobacter sp.]|nr:hypothetical protein [Rubrobacter sp.]